MVLQQDLHLPVWGTAEVGERVTVTVGKESGTATAGADGKWMVKLPPLSAGSSSVTMTVAGKNTLTFSDVLVGDVWVCSGQSNMAFAVPKAEAGEAKDPQIRFYGVPDRASFQPESDIPAKWVVCTPETTGKFSSVAYYFARELRSTLKRPIGLIGAYWVGSGAAPWVSISGLRKEPSLKCYVDAYEQRLAAYPQSVAIYPALMEAYQAAQTKWEQNYGETYREARKKWGEEWSKSQKAGTPEPPKPPMPPEAPGPPLPPEGGGRVPSSIFNGMVAPLVPYGIKGAIWYQGESNHARPLEYKTLLSRLIADWRENWGQGDFPFLVVQLPNFQQAVQSWPFVRESQLKTVQSVPNAGLAVTIDVGEPVNLHPPHKLYVGLRLAQAAKRVAYGQEVVYSGPIFESAKSEGSAIRVLFREVGAGLTIGSAPYLAPGVAPLPTTSLAGFMIAGEDRYWVLADAKIEGNSVLVSSPQVANPVAIRYAWENAPRCNLYNKEGLPTSPFRTDDWPPDFKTDDWNPYNTVPHAPDYAKGLQAPAAVKSPVIPAGENQ